MRLTDDKTAKALKEISDKLKAGGFEVDVSNERYIKLAEYEQTGLEPEQIRHGRWINVIGDDYECSNCKAALWARKAYPITEYKYCWSCGAKMDGGDQE